MALFIWLNTWVKSTDNCNGLYFGVYVALLVANSVSSLLQSYFEYNSDFFVNLHRAMVLNLLTAPMSYFETTSVSKTINKLSSDLKKVDDEVIPQFRNTIYFIGSSTSFVANSIYAYISKG
jgi:ABC-type siderophore export system fused ATPase/permease subunit